MTKRYPVEITVINVEGRPCPRGMQKGQSWMYTGLTPGDMCLGGFNTVAPTMQIFYYGGDPPGVTPSNPDVCVRRCPDPHVGVVYELRRLRED